MGWGWGVATVGRDGIATRSWCYETICLQTEALGQKKPAHCCWDSAIGFNLQLGDISRSGGPSTFPIKQKVNPVRDLALGLGDTKQGPESSVVRGSSGLEENKARLTNA